MHVFVFQMLYKHNKMFQDLDKEQKGSITIEKMAEIYRIYKVNIWQIYSV